MRVLVWCQSKFNQTGDVRLFATQVLEGSRPIFCCLPVPRCGFKRRIWRRPSSECHLNPSDVYSTLFHVSQCLEKMSASDMVTKKATVELMWEWSSWNLLHTDVLHFLYDSGYTKNQTYIDLCFICCLIWYLNMDITGISRCFVSIIHRSLFIWPLLCFYISFLYSGAPFILFMH